jgi:hypothetical protein
MLVMCYILMDTHILYVFRVQGCQLFRPSLVWNRLYNLSFRFVDNLSFCWKYESLNFKAPYYLWNISISLSVGCFHTDSLFSNFAITSILFLGQILKLDRIIIKFDSILLYFISKDLSRLIQIFVSVFIIGSSSTFNYSLEN